MSEQFNQKEESFVEKMCDSLEKERIGYSILLKRNDFPRFFDLLANRGLFLETRNQGPVPSGKEGYVHIPFWPALDYLLACAKHAKRTSDEELASKVLSVVRGVSSVVAYPDNYHTSRVFAEILGELAPDYIKEGDLALIQAWLADRFDTGLVTKALDEILLDHLFSSPSPEHWRMACIVLQHCTAVKWEASRADEAQRKPVTVAEDYWLNELLQRHAKSFGERCGETATAILLGRVREVFSDDVGRAMSYMVRPAVEEHGQNRDWETVRNLFVDGAREVLLAWIRSSAHGAQKAVRSAFDDSSAMVRRIAIFSVNECWGLLGDLFSELLPTRLFATDSLHESYQLLSSHFSELAPTLRERVVEAIIQLPAPAHSSEPDVALNHIKARWLSAIRNKGSATADQLFSQLTSSPEGVSPGAYPDLIAHIETRVGPGESPYEVKDIFAFAEDGTLIEKLNGFVQTDPWRGPTASALVNALEEAASLNPRLFVSILSNFVSARRPYQYGVLAGLKKAWESKKTSVPDWGFGWLEVMRFIDALISSEEFWSEQGTETRDFMPTSEWIVGLAADLLNAGTSDDGSSYPAELLPEGWDLLNKLLTRTRGSDEPTDDPMTQALNTPKGRVLGALISHALRTCRVADSARGSHAAEWETMRRSFERELFACGEGRYEFLALSGAYVSQYFYMSPDWLAANIQKIFSDNAEEFECAVAGLAFASINRPVYSLLAERKVFQRAIRSRTMGGRTREQIVERIGLAYLWGDEELDSPVLAYLLSARLTDDLRRLGWYLATARHESLSAPQIQRVIRFWERCVELGANDVGGKELLGSLTALSSFLVDLDARSLGPLLASAPYAQLDHSGYQLVKELRRFASSRPMQVVEVLTAYLRDSVPSFDLHGELKELVDALAEIPEARLKLILIVDRLRHLPGMTEVFKKLKTGG